MEYCAICQPTAEINDWAEGRTHSVPVTGDSAQKYAMIRRRQRAFLNALCAGTGETWPEYETGQVPYQGWKDLAWEACALEEVFTPEEQAFIVGATDDLCVSRLPFNQHARFNLVIKKRVRNAIRGFRKGESAFMEWREFEYALATLTPKLQEAVRKLFLLLKNMGPEPHKGLAQRKWFARRRNYRRRILRYLRHVNAPLLYNAWFAHFKIELQTLPLASEKRVLPVAA